jgi:hypothetical protein
MEQHVDDRLRHSIELAVANSPVDFTIGTDAVTTVSSNLLTWTSPIRFSLFVIKTAHDLKTSKLE